MLPLLRCQGGTAGEHGLFWGCGVRPDHYRNRCGLWLVCPAGQLNSWSISANRSEEGRLRARPLVRAPGRCCARGCPAGFLHSGTGGRAARCHDRVHRQRARHLRQALPAPTPPRRAHRGRARRHGQHRGRRAGARGRRQRGGTRRKAAARGGAAAGDGGEGLGVAPVSPVLRVQHLVRSQRHGVRSAARPCLLGHHHHRLRGL
mmetsp:Transcript_85688/g.237496  ORF Transcript_85688/g.237496 Transcript_85688/m.237496 type:complete len:204 (+) Transcript_85688:1498-2109(+)